MFLKQVTSDGPWAGVILKATSLTHMSEDDLRIQGDAVAQKPSHDLSVWQGLSQSMAAGFHGRVSKKREPSGCYTFSFDPASDVTQHHQILFSWSTALEDSPHSMGGDLGSISCREMCEMILRHHWKSPQFLKSPVHCASIRITQWGWGLGLCCPECTHSESLTFRYH